MSSKRPGRGSRGGEWDPRDETSTSDPEGDAPSGGGGSGGRDDGGRGGPGGAGTNDPSSFNFNDSVLSELQNLGIFPPPGAAPSTGGGAAAAPLKRTVEQALQTVLGRLPRSGDHKSFVAALNMSFTYKEEAGGRSGYQWTPRTYIGKTDLGGGVTGAQASLVSFARSAYDSSVTLLEGLSPLLPDTDREEVEAARAIVRSLWAEFVGELGKEGGPRVERADSLSTILLGNRKSPDTQRDSQLARLGMLLGMVRYEELEDRNRPKVDELGRPDISRNAVVTTEEEANLTSFVSMSDYMFSVQASWDNYVNHFFRNDLGTGLVHLARLFSVLAETVDEVYSAMDSVYFGPAERLTIRVGPDPRSLSVEELLSWVHTFATEEAPLLIQEGGRRGVAAITPTAELLREQMDKFFRHVQGGARERARRERTPGQPPGAPDTGQGEGANVLPVGLVQPRVLNPIKDVYRYLDELVKQAKQISE